MTEPPSIRARALAHAQFFALLIAAAAMPWLPAAIAADDAAGHFDAEIAPLLARRCVGCHNATAKKGGLDLSTRDAAAAGGKTGRAIEAGKPDDSLLWNRIDADEMPPKEPLSDVEKKLLQEWIAKGAPWGAKPQDPLRPSVEQRADENWWSLQPPPAVEPPAVKDGDWPRNEIDRFILAKLEAAGLAPAPEADVRTLIRRLYFDLIGLPPTRDEFEKWSGRLAVSDSRQREEAYQQLVEDLLESPHYGERWARHWLDVVRFGESQGFERNKIRENAWRYRDWVIDALNADLPYDEFVRRQIAGDVLHPGDLSALIATGYHVCGTWDQVGYNEGSAEMRKAVRQDGLEDLVATLGQAYLGLTIHCARCHDHKFDPISQREYYQIAAALGGVTQEEKERQGISAPPTPQYAAWKAAADGKRRELEEFEKSIRGKYAPDGGNHIPGLQLVAQPGESGTPLFQDRSENGEPMDLAQASGPRRASAQPPAKLIQAAKKSGEFTIEAWITPESASQTGPARIVTLSQDTGQRNFTLGQEGNRFDVRFRTTKTDQNGMPSLAGPEGSVAARRMHVVFTFDKAGMWRLYVDARQVAEKNGGGDLSNWNDSYRLVLGDELSGERVWKGELHFAALYTAALSPQQIEHNFQTDSRDVRAGQSIAELVAKASTEEQARHKTLQQELRKLVESEPASEFAGVAHAIIPQQPPVFNVLARGDYRNPLEVVSPAGLRSLSKAGLPGDWGLKPDAPEAERRIKLAAWLTDPRNPLTSRVLVNRLWHYHFGVGIVDTPSDFGFVGGRPTHPELLDWLTVRFVEGGWKIKAMHRLIVTSATYRQASNVANAEAQAVDADNRLRWRGSAHRLEGEAVRDAVLAVSGALNPRLGGPSFRDMKVDGGKMGTNAEFTDPTGEFGEQVNRRTIYRLWARSGNNPFLDSLDCPDTAVMFPRRTQTITPVQSLSLLNNRFMEQCAGRLAEQVKADAGDDVDQQIARSYAGVLCRAPQPAELELAREFVRRRGIVQLCLVLLNTNEFLFVE